MPRVLASSYRVRSTAPARPTAPVLWPRYLPGPGGQRKLQMVPIPAQLIPPGWQNVSVKVPMRLASCEEVECPFYRNGWTEVLPADGSQHTRSGKVTSDEAAETFGLYGPRELAPTVIHHPPGTTCPGDGAAQTPGERRDPRAHMVPSGLPPLYRVNGRTVLWNEFEDAIGEGVHSIQRS